MENDTLKASNSTAKQIRKYARRLAFTKFVESKRQTDEEDKWICCGQQFCQLREVHHHASLNHKEEVDILYQDILQNGSHLAKWSVLRRADDSVKHNDEPSIEGADVNDLPSFLKETDTFPWFPEVDGSLEHEKGQVLLYYRYRNIKNTTHVCNWQEMLCKRLGLTGKIRIATEGINGTVGGTMAATQLYVQAMLNHPLFCDMSQEDFKSSSGGAEDFPCLKVGVYAEIVPMGVDPKVMSYRDAGQHLNPEEFHRAVEKLSTNEDNEQERAVLIDCRNFYESRIGNFRTALKPDIRKFSYWPEYVDENLDLFRDKEVYMYCTGGIRCERGSAYLMKKGVCKAVYQLEGGIHKYLEKFPDGHYRGKLFVFDNRYSIKSNDDIISECRYCGQPWDTYKPCSSGHCHQLVLSCDQCSSQGLTACCPHCQRHDSDSIIREECECTHSRVRIPVETTGH